MNGFFRKPLPYHPANSLRCLPVTAVRLILYSSLQSDHTKFLYFVPFCFFRRRTTVACSSSIDRLQLVCFVKGNSLFPFFRGCPSPLSATPTFLPDPFVSFTDIFPRSGKSPTLWGITLAELSQLDRSCQQAGSQDSPKKSKHGFAGRKTKLHFSICH